MDMEEHLLRDSDYDLYFCVFSKHLFGPGNDYLHGADSDRVVERNDRDKAFQIYHDNKLGDLNRHISLLPLFHERHNKRVCHHPDLCFIRSDNCTDKLAAASCCENSNSKIRPIRNR